MGARRFVLGSRKRFPMFKYGVKLTTILPFLFLVMFTLSGSLSSGVTSSGELSVPGDCETIQECINKAQAGDTILIAEGTYMENLIIEKSLILEGVGRDKVKIQAAARGKPVIQLMSDNLIEVVIQGLTISGAKNVSSSRICTDRSAGLCPYGISIRGQVRAAIQESKVSDNQGDGLWVDDSSMVILINSIISSNGNNGLSVRGSARATLISSIISNAMRYGLFARDSAQVTLQDSTVSDNRRTGLLFWHGVRVNLTNTTISSNRGNGLDVEDLAYVTLTNTIVSSNWYSGISILGSARLEVKGSMIEGNGTVKGCRTDPDCISNGILVRGKAQVSVYNSTIKDNIDWGIAAVLRKCGYGLDLFTGEVILSNNEIYGNGRGQVCLP